MARTKVQLKIERVASFADGAAFGDAGPYERLVGKVAFALDPEDPKLPFIADLHLAPRNPAGLVEFEADLDILKPVEPARGNRRLLYDVNNRGGRTALRFNDATPSADPTTAAHAGNGFLMRQGYTVVWSGWQGDLVSDGNNLVAHLPEARQDGEPLRGRVRQEFIADSPGVLSLPVSGGANIHSYPVLGRDSATLTVREHEADARQTLDASDWDLQAPLGTYTGWSLRKAGFAEGELLSLNGSFLPFSRTRAEREAAGDPRPSIEERYAGHQQYVEAVTQAVESLQSQGFLLAEDAERYVRAARERNPLDPATSLGPLLAGQV